MCWERGDCDDGGVLVLLDLLLLHGCIMMDMGALAIVLRNSHDLTMEVLEAMALSSGN